MRKRVNTSAAVRQQKVAKVQEKDTPEQRLFRALNYFPTPPWGARAGAEILRELDPEALLVWEPACGEGHMASALKEYFPFVLATDIHPFGYGEVADFLQYQDAPEIVDWVVTNPPFDKAEEFLVQGLRLAKRGVALLLRIAFLEGSNRYPQVYLGETPLTLCAPFIERVSMVLGQYDPDASQPMCMAWFFFQKGASPKPIRPIPPGTFERLFKVEDVRRFAKMADAPLFDRVADVQEENFEPGVLSKAATQSTD